MKIVAITPRLVENEAYNEIREAFDINWPRFIIQAGATPFLLSTSHTENIIERMMPDGLVLTGGNDLASVNQNNLSRTRDSFEKNLLKLCIKNKTPVIGICRGLQLIAEFFGAEISQTPGHTGQRHMLEINSLETIEANSYHNWGVRELPACLELLARTPDGVVEALRHKEHNITALMWHPERENPFKENDLNIFRKAFKI